MNESILLRVAVFGGVLGCVALLFLPALPPQEFIGIVSWQNGSHAWVSSCSDVWVEASSTIPEKDSCVVVHGFKEGSSFSEASFQVDPQVCHRLFRHGK